MAENINSADNAWNQEETVDEDESQSTSNTMDASSSEPFIRNNYCQHSNANCYDEDKMRRKLKFFFMNPVEKWQAKRRFPYKFIVQIIKIVLVTTQLCLFAHNNYIHVNYTWDNRIAFSHLFLRGWDSVQEVPAYPPASGPFAIYKQDDFYETVNFALDGYYNLNNSIGSYSYDSEDNSRGPVILCLQHYKKGIIFGFNESYIFDNEIEELCVNITHKYNDKFSIGKVLMDENVKINFSSLIKAELKFAIKTVNLKAAGPITPPDCYTFKIKIIFDNKDFDGQMLLSLDTEPRRLLCKGLTHYYPNSQLESALRTLLNLFVILICTFSLILCSRAIYRAQLLKYETMGFFKRTFNVPLSLQGRLEFLNLWYIMIIINDLLIIIGSGIKEQIERKHFGNDHWNICSIFLGTGNLLVWFGVLRYLGFFKTYNVVILTLKKAAPEVARFLLCAILIYAGFTFCGWLILGPYHMKFQTLASTSECLFALINGDDMFATFSMTSVKSPMLWWFSRIYLYTFTSLYIYVVLSLFISVIMDAYETIKLYYRDGFPKNDLQTFIAMQDNDILINTYNEYSENSELGEFFERFCCQRKRNDSMTANNSSANKPEQICGAICI
ncbi:mucolipin-3-like [Leptopilina boulardi]|uniref:mucolipin-3-like n=1 Tax=Leptopilina boulardi TaxID=63433 RepID=UPI0021F5F452|nr:mucolipin-3-like [Leptopilina boulardi]